VLVVDDTRTNRELLRALLGRAGHAARIACDGAEAVAAVQEEVPDLVLMDVACRRWTGSRRLGGSGR
jgi:two-component system OmpR family response regulator